MMSMLFKLTKFSMELSTTNTAGATTAIHRNIIPAQILPVDWEWPNVSKLDTKTDASVANKDTINANDARGLLYFEYTRMVTSYECNRRNAVVIN